jgi:hypothetical protein
VILRLARQTLVLHVCLGLLMPFLLICLNRDFSRISTLCHSEQSAVASFAKASLDCYLEKVSVWHL